nr:hypothetical protein [Tanacetum cinerariifolium]
MVVASAVWRGDSGGWKMDNGGVDGGGGVRWRWSGSEGGVVMVVVAAAVAARWRFGGGEA